MIQNTQKPKLLFVITQGLWGGAQRYIFDIATHSPAYEVTVAVGESKGATDLQKKLHAAHIRVVQLHHLKRTINPLDDWRAIMELQQLYTTEKPDIIHLNSSKVGVLGSYAAQKYKKIPVIYTVHGWAFLEPGNILKKNTLPIGRKNHSAL